MLRMSLSEFFFTSDYFFFFIHKKLDKAAKSAKSLFYLKLFIDFEVKFRYCREVFYYPVFCSNNKLCKMIILGGVFCVVIVMFLWSFSRVRIFSWVSGLTLHLNGSESDPANLIL